MSRLTTIIISSTLCLLLGCWPRQILGQADSLWQEVFTLSDIDRFSVDPLQQLLGVDQDGVVWQYSPTGQPLFRYHNTTLGENFTIDATDPFNILLFYKDQQSIILLDRTLSVRASLDLRDTEILYATAVARSHDNNLWIYDELSGRLYRLNARGEILFRSNDFRLSEKLSEGPTEIIRWNDRILLNFPDRGLALFSVLGQLLEWWPIQHASQLFFHEGSLYFQQDSVFFRHQPQQNLTEALNWPGDKIPSSFLLQPTRRYLLQEGGELLIQVSKANTVEKN